MSYEHKEPLPDQQPPQYGAQSPPPQQMYHQHTGQTYVNTPPPAEVDRSYQAGAPMQQYPPQPQQGQYITPQQSYPQQPQQAHYPQGQGHPVQQGQYQPQQAHHGSVGGQQFQNVVPLAGLSSSPAPVQCPSCGQRAMTRTAFVTGNTTHGWAAGLCAVLCLGCIPYCMTSMKDVEHRCGNCGVHLATWHRSGRTEIHMYG